jgi:hypothetical protein
MSTLLAIRTKVRANWPTGYHTATITDAVIDGWINDAQRQLCRRYTFAFMEMEVQKSTTTLTRKYLVPIAGDTGWVDVNSGTTRKFKSEITLELFDQNSERIPLKKLNKPSIEIKSLFRSTTDAGTPMAYCKQNGYYELWPLPDHTQNGGNAFTMNLEYYGYLADLSGDTDHNVLSDLCPEYLERMATAFGYYFGQDSEMGNEWKQRAEEVFAEILSEDVIDSFGTIEEGLHPMDGQSCGDNGTQVYDIKAHYA